MTRTQTFGTVVVFLSMLSAGSNRCPGEDEGFILRTPQPVIVITPSIHSTRDQFSGKVVADKTMAWEMMEHRQPNAPRVGEAAPEFHLQTADGNREVSLSALRKDKPVVLLLTSWGCDLFRESSAGVFSLHSRYQDQINFVMVYIREAHPQDGFAGLMGRVNDPRNSDERAAVARRCREQMRLPWLVLVDPVEDPVATRWGAWPTRLFVIETDGKVAYAGARGPGGYRPYRGYFHGSGKREGWALQFSAETLEEFLEMRFPTKSKDPATPAVTVSKAER